MKFWIVRGFAVAVLALALSGCSGSTGWRVSFGVSPVTAIDEQQTHTKQTQPKLVRAGEKF